MKILLSSVLLTLFTFSAFGQNAVDRAPLCTNQTVEKISSRGVRLGITLQETFNLLAENNKLTAVNISYPESAGTAVITTNELDFQVTLERHQEYAKKNFGFSFARLGVKNKPNFDGISHYDLGFLDNRLAFFNVYYLKPKWENIEQFIGKLSETLSLPDAKEWNFNNRSSVNCGNYMVEARRSNDEASYSMLVSNKIDEILNLRRKKAEDEQREKDIKAFRP